MTLDEVVGCVLATEQAINKAYEKGLFDEYAVVSLRNREVRLLWYQGTRRETFARQFAEETASLRQEARNRLFRRPYEAGEFEFAMEGGASEVEAFITLAPDLYVVCGNTAHTMAELAADPLWLNAQTNFVQLSERFLTDPLVLRDEDAGQWLASY